VHRAEAIIRPTDALFYEAMEGLTEKSVSSISQVVFGDEVEGFLRFWEVFVKGPENLGQVQFSR